MADKLHRWTQALMLTADAADLPDVLVRELLEQFLIPQGAIRVWGAAEAFAGLDFARPVGDDAKSFASSLTQPVLRRQRRLRGGRLARGRRQRALAGADPAARCRQPDRLRPAGAGLARRRPATAPTWAPSSSPRIGEIASAALARLLPAAVVAGDPATRPP